MNEKKAPTVSDKSYGLDDLLLGRKPLQLKFEKPDDEKLSGERLKQLVKEYATQKGYGSKVQEDTSDRQIIKLHVTIDVEGFHCQAQYWQWSAELDKIRHLLVDERDIHPPGKYLRIYWAPALSRNIVSVVTITGSPYKDKRTGAMVYPSDSYKDGYYHGDLHNSALVFQYSPEVEIFGQGLCVKADYADFCIIRQLPMDKNSAEAFREEMNRAYFDREFQLVDEKVSPNRW